MIRVIQNQMVGVSLSSIAMFECFVEAFPFAVTYWERADGRVLENGEKYKIATKDSGIYKVHNCSSKKLLCILKIKINYFEQLVL